MTAAVLLLVDVSLDILLVLVSTLAAGVISFVAWVGFAVDTLVAIADSFDRLVSRSRDGGFRVVALRLGIGLGVRLRPVAALVLRVAEFGIGVSMWGSGFLIKDGVLRVGSGGLRLLSTAAEMSGRRSDPTRAIGSDGPVDRRDMDDGIEILCRLSCSLDTAGVNGVAVWRGVRMDESVMSRVELKSRLVRVASMLLRIWRRFWNVFKKTFDLRKQKVMKSILTITTRSLSLIVSILN